MAFRRVAPPRAVKPERFAAWGAELIRSDHYALARQAIISGDRDGVEDHAVMQATMADLRDDFRHGRQRFIPCNPLHALIWKRVVREVEKREKRKKDRR